MAERAIDRLRREARNAIARANRKINRVESNGVNVRGSRYDPTTRADQIQHMRARDLNRLINRVNQFTNRNNQFVAGRGGSPIPMSEWQRYQQAEQKVNQQRTDLYNKVKDYKLPDGTTIAGYHEARDVKNRRSIKAANDIHKEIHRNPAQIANVDALKKLRLSLEKRSTSEIKKDLKEARKQFRQMVKVIHDRDLEREIRGMSDEQFYILWHDTEFPDLISGAYEVAAGHSHLRPQDLNTTFDTSMSDARKMVDWAKAL